MLRAVDLPGLLVSADWLRERIGADDLVVADVRMVPDGRGREDYERGHLPRAVYLDVDADLSAPPSGDDRGRHPLPDPDLFAEAMRRSGVDDDDAVVVYDDGNGGSAARLWWLLDVLGHRVGLLDGGLSAWGTQLESGPQAFRPPGWFSARPWPTEHVVRTDDVERIVRDGGTVLVDARATERYTGEHEPIDPVAGHIPGAINLPFSGNVDPRTNRFLSPEQLRRRFEGAGIARADDTVVYCGSGVTASHDVLAMRVAGLGTARLYEGSFSGWIAGGDRPIATGDEPGGV